VATTTITITTIRTTTTITITTITITIRTTITTMPTRDTPLSTAM
jgi:hypothetical protein